MNNFLALAIRSIELDIRWLTIELLPQKYVFLWKKYIFLALYPLYWDKHSRAYVINLWNRNIFLENRENLGIIQSVFIFNSALKKIIPKNCTVVDIGAHTGEFALFCDVYLTAKQIYSFEPIDASYNILQKNKQTHTFHTAIGTSKKIVMHIPKHAAMASSIATREDIYQEEVPCTSLDSIAQIQQLESIDLLKVDVEGMEYDVLRASENSLQKSRHILVELSVDRPAYEPALQTIKYLMSILPKIKLVHIGQIFQITPLSSAVDIVLHNPSANKN